MENVQIAAIFLFAGIVFGVALIIMFVLSKRRRDDWQTALEVNLARNFTPNDTVVRLEQRMDDGFETVRNEVGHLRDLIVTAVMQKSWFPAPNPWTLPPRCPPRVAGLFSLSTLARLAKGEPRTTLSHASGSKLMR
jgi:hypothetical protein